MHAACRGPYGPPDEAQAQCVCVLWFTPRAGGGAQVGRRRGAGGLRAVVCGPRRAGRRTRRRGGASCRAARARRAGCHVRYLFYLIKFFTSYEPAPHDAQNADPGPRVPCSCSALGTPGTCALAMPLATRENPPSSSQSSLQNGLPRSAQLRAAPRAPAQVLVHFCTQESTEEILLPAPAQGSSSTHHAINRHHIILGAPAPPPTAPAPSGVSQG